MRCAHQLGNPLHANIAARDVCDFMRQYRVPHVTGPAVAVRRHQNHRPHAADDAGDINLFTALNSDAGTRETQVQRCEVRRRQGKRRRTTPHPVQQQRTTNQPDQLRDHAEQPDCHQDDRHIAHWAVGANQVAGANRRTGHQLRRAARR